MIASPPAEPLGLVDRHAIRVSVIWIAIVLLIFMAARLLSPQPGQTLMISGVGIVLPELCSLRRLLDVDCPGCGLTRSFVLAARFRLADAWAMHPSGTLLAIYLAATVPQRLWRLRRLLAGLPARSMVAWEIGLGLSLIAAAYVRWVVLSLGLIGR